MYKAILWDLDDTLLDFEYSQNCSLRQAFAELELGEFTDEMAQIYTAINARYWEALENGEMTRPQILVGRFAEFLRTMEMDDSLAGQLNSTYEGHLGEYPKYCEHAKEVVLHYKGKILQCMTSNGLKHVQDKKLEGSGLDKIFDRVYISEEVGFEKPSKSFFDFVANDLNITDRSQMIIVGDSLTSDIRGGINSGIKTIWYNPKRKVNDRGIEPDMEIHDLLELKDIV